MDQSPNSLRLAPVAGKSLEQELNVEQLIKDIFESQPIWNSPGVKTDVHWIPISIKYNLPVDLLKRKWAGLRKSFRNELKKLPRNERNEYMLDPCSYSSNWPYYRSMLFLVDRIHLQPVYEIPVKATVKTEVGSSSRIAGKKRRLDADGGNDDEDFETINTTPFGNAKRSRNEDDPQKQIGNATDTKCDSEIVETTESLPQMNSQLSVQTVVRSVVEEIEVSPDVFERQIPDLKQLGTESDYLFLMSLHQFMGKVHPLRKLYVRSLIQNALYEELSTMHH